VNQTFVMKKELSMSSIPEVSEMLSEVLNDDARSLARETGFIKRKRAFDGADFAQSLIFGWLQEPDISLGGLCQVFARRELTMTAPGLTQRFGKASAAFFQRLMEALAAKRLRVEAHEASGLLKRFTSVIVEDSSVVGLPGELASFWKGCGGHAGASEGGVKLYVRWDVLSGELSGPMLTDAKRNDRRSPFELEDLPARGLYLADLGFFSQGRLEQITRYKGSEKRYVITRMLSTTNIYRRNGQQLNLRSLLPAKVGEAREVCVLVGKRARLTMRLLLVRVPKNVANERRERMKEDAKDHGRKPLEETLFLADWTLILTNVPQRLLSLTEVLVCYRLRWQIERLFRLWKEYGKIDEWRSKKPYRILTELYAKICAMIIQQWLLQLGCWEDPHRSFFLAAGLVRRESNRLMVALYEGGVLTVLTAIIDLLRRAGGHLTRRKTHPGSDQLLLEGLEWPITVLT
jgi:hypothetical protein